MSNYKTVFFILNSAGNLGVFMFIPVITQFIYNEIRFIFFWRFNCDNYFERYFSSNLDHDKKINLQTFIDSIIMDKYRNFWVPTFVFSSVEFSFTDAFESMSGITTTGSTIISNLESMPKVYCLSLLQWLGGIGIIVMAITLMPLMNVGGMQLFKISNNDTSEKNLQIQRNST